MRKLFLAASVLLQTIVSAEAEEINHGAQMANTVPGNGWEEARANPPESPVFAFRRPAIPIVVTTASSETPTQNVLTTWDLMQFNFGM